MLQPIDLVRIDPLRPVAAETPLLPLRVMEHEWDQALDVGEIDLMQAPVEQFHQAALEIPEPFPISVYFFFGDGPGGFAFANSRVSALARVMMDRSTLIHSIRSVFCLTSSRVNLLP